MNPLSLRSRLRMAFWEDGAFRDVTSSYIPNIHKLVANARLMAHEDGVFCGGFLVKPLLNLLDRRMAVKVLARDGSRIRRGQTLARMRGRAYALLAGERTLLNIICHLSGISTLTGKYVQAVKGSGTKILDTRKTTPLWRDLEKIAVKTGGAENNRINLADAVLVKDNHLDFLRHQNLKAETIFHVPTIRRKKQKIKFVEMEAKTLSQVWSAIKAEAEIILLDNMSIPLLKESISLIRAARRSLNRSTPQIEISGGVSLPKAKIFSRLGVERLSVGALTHSAPSLDLSLEVY